MAWEPTALVDDESIRPFLRGIDSFCSELLPSEPPSHSERKIIADPIEGYCSITGWEHCLIDTPLFQRLRGIRQLGLAYLVYPTLGYSRFEHVLGVRARLDQIIATLQANQAHLDERDERNSTLPSGPALEKQLDKMRLATLCHDLGHCLFSHVSEAVMTELEGDTSYPSASKIINAFHQWAGRDLPLSEIISISIVTSGSFIRYLIKTGIPNGSKLESAERIAHAAAHLIAGLPIPKDSSSLYLGQLLNGGLDIDKLDYMFRESLLSGVSLGISLGWLMKKLYIERLSFDTLPPALRSRVAQFPSNEQFAVLALERGGQFGFEEFCIARLALHEKIYLHQKIRSAEVQTRVILKSIVKAMPEYLQVHMWLHLKESLVDQPTAVIPQSSPLFSTSSSVEPWSPIVDRKLPVRAYAFGWPNSVSDPLTASFDSNDHAQNSVEQLIELSRSNPEEFEREIRSNLEEISNHLKIPNTAIQPEFRLFIDPPKLSTIQQGIDTVHFQYPARLSPHWTMPIDQIERYYYRNRALGYVFAIGADVPSVLLAAERAAYKLTKTVCIQEGLVGHHVGPAAEKMRDKLDAVGFYKEAPALRPVPKFLATLAAQEGVRDIAKRLASFESKTGSRVSPASVTTYLAQFDSTLQHAALTWLRHLTFVRPETGIREEINKIIKANGDYHSIGISPLGATTDSAAHLGYKLRDPLDSSLSQRVSAQVLPLPEALACKSDAYILYDDNVNSGFQALNIFAAWLEITLPNDLDLQEEHVQPLSAELQKEIKSKPLFLVFDIASGTATTRLMDLLVKHCGFEHHLLNCHAHRELKMEDKVFSGQAFQHDLKSELREFIVNVAVSIFRAEGRSEDAAHKRALGDDEAEAMIVFPYNCPTMTIPALWLRGEFQGREWIPLVERSRRRHPTTGRPIGEDV